MVHYHNMVRLVSARKPKDLTDEPWFKKGKEAMNGIQEKRRLEEEAAKEKADAPFRKMVEEDMKKVQAEAQKDDCKKFLKFINDNYAPAGKKLTLSEDDLQEGKLKRLITTKFSLMFHADKNVNEPRQVQILREEIMKYLNLFNEKFKWTVHFQLIQAPSVNRLLMLFRIQPEITDKN